MVVKKVVKNFFISRTYFPNRKEVKNMVVAGYILVALGGLVVILKSVF